MLIAYLIFLIIGITMVVAASESLRGPDDVHLRQFVIVLGIILITISSALIGELTAGVMPL